jgi:hypothetical protein
MVKVRSRGGWLEQIYATCDDCSWSRLETDEDSEKARSAARYHAVKLGHKVFIYVEKSFVIKPVEDTR